jgi:regulatory protein
MDTFDRYWNQALRFLSFRSRSEKEVSDYLLQKKVSEDIVVRILHKLKELDFINDEKFAVWWVEQRTTYRPRSARVIKLELKEKGIDREIIDTVVGTLYPANSELETAKTIIKKRVYKMQNMEYKELVRKLSQYLAQRGFDYDTIRSAIDDVCNKGV